MCVVWINITSARNPKLSMTRCLTSRQRRCTSQCRTVVLYAVMRVGWAAATVRRSIKLRYLTAVIMSFLGGPCICVFNRGKPGQWCHGHSLQWRYVRPLLSSQEPAAARYAAAAVTTCSLSVGFEQVSFVPRGKILNTMSMSCQPRTLKPDSITRVTLIDVIIPFYLHFQSCFIGSIIYILWL